MVIVCVNDFGIKKNNEKNRRSSLRYRATGIDEVF